MDSVVVVATELVVSSVVDVITTPEVHRINLIRNLRISRVIKMSLMVCADSNRDTPSLGLKFVYQL